jgi:pimeloyl-ACP methyl ester carboxylesterase
MLALAKGATMTTSNGVESAYFEHAGYRLHYKSYGEGDRVLVYLNGLLLDTELNVGIATSLADRGHRVVLLDLLGHGLSDKPDNESEYRMDTYAEQVVALFDHLELDAAVVGGISLGANVSLEAAMAAPDRVSGLIVEMPVLEDAVPAAALTFVPLLLAARYLSFIVGRFTGLVARAPRTPFGPANSFLGALSTPPEVMAAVLHGILVGPVGPSVAARASITCPALVLGHDRDFIHPFTDAERLAGQLADGRLLRAHSPAELRLRPDRLTRELADFLDEVWTPAAVV